MMTSRAFLDEPASVAGAHTTRSAADKDGATGKSS